MCSGMLLKQCYFGTSPWVIWTKYPLPTLVSTCAEICPGAGYKQGLYHSILLGCVFILSISYNFTVFRGLYSVLNYTLYHREKVLTTSDCWFVIYISCCNTQLSINLQLFCVALIRTSAVYYCLCNLYADVTLWLNRNNSRGVILKYNWLYYILKLPRLRRISSQF